MIDPMEDYRRRTRRAAKLEAKRDDIRSRERELFEALRAARELPGYTERAARRAEIDQELQGCEHDCRELHKEILAVWQS